ncbi:MAG: hypothetical protein QN141_07000 [Armatimonadota bacterium]|nr:hypothetical protein [Armatimonadota bacterium]MDR7450396.1 hypothetical protein [Armatimonadota bacterium]MDR7467021.1 hypothetical protein [Armatimonadota bacterium]MDR7493437.1 hypothetical protein [Armatimonadota bacterium]MDR7498702.1 hypothetical protein [Armatimonadota bacterium]
MRVRTDLETGAVLIGVLMASILVVVLALSALTVAAGEVLMAGLQRDGVRALEQAQAGVEEALRRMERGYPFVQGFSGSLSNSTSVSVARLVTGAGAAYQEIRVRADAGRAARRVHAIVLQRSTAVLPDTVVAGSILVDENGRLGCGDIYAHTYIRQNRPPMTGCDGADLTSAFLYAGWRIDDGFVACTSHADCVRQGRPTWYPGQRRGVWAASPLGREIIAQTLRCLPGEGGLPGEIVSGTLADGTAYEGPAFGFDTDDPDGAGSVPPQAVREGLPCGLPYKIVPETFLDDRGNVVTRLFKTIVYEQWLDTYWRFDPDTLSTVKRRGGACSPEQGPCLPGEGEPDLANHPQFGAVPPVPEVASLTANVDRRLRGGGRIAGGDFGCLHPPMRGDAHCLGVPADASRPLAVSLEEGSYVLDGTLRGHGTLVASAPLQLTGDVVYWGAVVASRGITLEGRAALWGAVATDGLLQVRGAAALAASSVPNVPLGPAVVVIRSWWER